MQVLPSNPAELKTVSSLRVQTIDKQSSPVSSTSSSFSSSSQTLSPDLVSISTLSNNGVPSSLSPVTEATGVSNISVDDAENEQSASVSGLVNSDGAQETGAVDESSADAVENQSPAETRGNQASDVGNSERSGNNSELTPAEQDVVAELAARDAEVRAHERAHQASGGQYTGSISYAYQQGPDGKRYAVGGEVPIDVAPISGDPQATINKMRIVQAAATAPAEPSSQDRSVAATAARLLAQAQVELAEQRRQESIEAREKASERDEQRREAVQTYESLIGLGAREIDPADLINELV